MQFFTYETQLPAGVGFTLFGAAHVAWLMGISLAVLIASIWFQQQPAYRQRQCSVGVAVLLCLMILLEKAVLAATGHLSVYSLPLHLCELSPFLYLLFTWRQWDWLGQVIYALCLPGGVAALFFPDWTVYPQWNFMNLSSFLVHGLLVLFPILQLISGAIRPRLGAIWKVWLFLAAVVPVIWLVNRAFGTNYFFINEGSPQSPLALLLEWTGPAWYLPAYILLAAAVMVLFLLPWTGKRRR